MILLKQATTATIKMGPFLSSSDGDTQRTALAIAQADIRLSKNGGAFAQSHNAAGAAHDEHGYYGVPLDATDTDTVGRLRVHIHVATALAVWENCFVLPASVYDALTGVVTLADDIDTQLSAVHGAGKWDASAFVLPAMGGRIYSATAAQDREVTITRGDTPRISFDLGQDYAGWTPYFGAKARLADTEYAIAVKAASWTDASAGQGYVDLTSGETATAGRLVGELQLRQTDQRLTVMRFILKIAEGVIEGS